MKFGHFRRIFSSACPQPGTAAGAAAAADRVLLLRRRRGLLLLRRRRGGGGVWRPAHFGQGQGRARARRRRRRRRRLRRRRCPSAPTAPPPAQPPLLPPARIFRRLFADFLRVFFVDLRKWVGWVRRWEVGGGEGGRGRLRPRRKGMVSLDAATSPAYQAPCNPPIPIPHHPPDHTKPN